jgi:hypothetical protein
MDYIDLRVAAIDVVITNATDRGSDRAWHTGVYLGPCSSGKRKEECPHFLLDGAEIRITQLLNG